MAGPTQFKSTDTRRWWLGYGSGVDGDLTISGNTTEAPIDSACTGTATETHIHATNASFAVGQAVLIHQTQGTGAGQWELGYITGYTAGTITLKDSIFYSYTTGAQVRVLKQYKNVTINNGVTYTAKAWNGTVGGILAFLANGILTVTGTITATGKGFRGGAARPTGSQLDGYCGEGTVGATAVQASANGNGGGGAKGFPGRADGGGGGANGANGSNGEVINGYGAEGKGGSAVGNVALTSLSLGGGGGAGGAAGNAGNQTAGSGGDGGGIIYIVGKTITVTGAVVASGNVGIMGSGGATDAGSGGGGGGGSVLIKSQLGTLGSTKITAPAGAGGADPGNGGYGGNGGTGRIHLDYVVSYTGTTTPTLDATQDLTLRQPIKRRIVI